MDRRKFLKTVSAASVATGGTLVAAPVVHAEKKINWKMVTAWPKNFPGLGSGANKLAQLIEDMSAGRIKIKVYGAGEMVPAFEVFDAVSKGTAQMGHASSMYWKGKSEAAQFFSGIPFGFSGQEMDAWLYHGGGLKLWNDLYADFGLVPAAAGNSGVQMAGWFNREINSLEDIKGLKMRIPGMGGEVIRRAGGMPVNIPGGEIFSSLKSGTIDATEWIGPYNDLAFGFHKAAKYYYYPGWHEPGTTLECMINKKALEELPKDLQIIVLNACRVANEDLFAEFTAKNAFALQEIKKKPDVETKKLPDDVLKKLRELSQEVIMDLAEKDQSVKKVYESFQAFRTQVLAWHDISERAYFNARN